MYLKNKAILIYKIKNVIFNIIGSFLVLMSVYVILSLIYTYRDNLETVMYAVATPQCIRHFILGVILLIQAGISRQWIGDAIFYSGYFEGDLNGYISLEDLKEVTGKSTGKLQFQLKLFLKLYLKNYSLQEVDKVNQVILNSKTSTCECRNCGAIIEKKMYFTGTCKYCGSSDLFARVWADNRFYSITNETATNKSNVQFYDKEKYTFKKLLYVLGPLSGLGVIVTNLCMIFDSISKMNDKEYLGDLLLSGEGPPSFEFIQNDLMDMVLMGVITILILLPMIWFGLKRVNSLFATESCANYFKKCKKPFVDIETVPVVKERNNKKSGIKLVRSAMRYGFLKNCTLDKHDNKLRVALAKKIVKDACPHCNAPIVGAIDANYTCKYCGKTIMGVMERT